VTSNEQSVASFWQHEDVLLLFFFAVHHQRLSVEVEVGDEENADERDQTHEQGETVGKHALWREFRILGTAVAKSTTNKQ